MQKKLTELQGVKMTVFMKGDRVKFNDDGRKLFPRYENRTGIVTWVSRFLGYVNVRWSGDNTVAPYATMIIEKVVGDGR